MMQRNEDAEQHAVVDHEEHGRHAGQDAGRRGQDADPQIVGEQKRREEEFFAPGLIATGSQRLKQLLGRRTRLPFARHRRRPEGVRGLRIRQRGEVSDQRTADQ